MALKAVFPLERRRTVRIYSSYSECRSAAQEMQERKKTQLQGFARKGNGARVVSNGVHANRTVTKTRNTIMMEYSGGVHLVNKLQKEFSNLQASNRRKTNA